MQNQILIAVGMTFASTTPLFASEVHCPNQSGPLSPALKLVQTSDHWTLTVGPLYHDQALALLKNLPHPEDLGYLPVLVLTFPKDACILSGKGDAGFSCEGGWGGANPPVAFPMTLVDHAGQERAHYSISSIILDVSYNTVAVPRVKVGDMIWSLYRLTLYASSRDKSVIAIKDEDYDHGGGFCTRQ